MDPIPGIDAALLAQGKQFGQLPMAAPGPDGKAVDTVTPVCIVQHGTGPTVTFAGGLHRGDAIGPVALLQLAGLLNTTALNGRVVILPSLPAGPSGSPASGLAADPPIETTPDAGRSADSQAALVAASQLVVTLRSGDGGLCYAPTCALVRQGSADQQAGAEAAMIAFGAPNSLRLQHLPAADTLGRAVIDAGGRFLAAYLGGSGGTDPLVQELAVSGCLNILVALGMLDAEFTLRATRMLRIPDERYTLTCPHAGIPALVRQIGHEVYRGEPVARVYNPADPAARPLDIPAPVDGILLAGFHGATAQAGDVLAILADEVAQ